MLASMFARWRDAGKFSLSCLRSTSPPVSTVDPDEFSIISAFGFFGLRLKMLDRKNLSYKL